MRGLICAHGSIPRLTCVFIYRYRWAADPGHHHCQSVKCRARSVKGCEGAVETVTSLPSLVILLQVVPLSCGGHAGLAVAFAIADLGGMNEMAYLETALSGQVIDAGEHVAKVVWLWESLRAEALQAKQSVEFIKEVAK